MLKPELIEANFKKLMEELPHWIDNENTHVNLRTLEENNLILISEKEEKDIQKNFPFYFHVIETEDKVTLFNEQFIVWILPRILEGRSETITIVSMLYGEKPQIQMVLTHEGVYNNSRFILRALRYFLVETIRTEKELSQMKIEG